MCINTYQNLINTIESLERRIEKHNEVICKIQEIIKDCIPGEMILPVKKTLQETIKEIYN